MLGESLQAIGEVLHRALEAGASPDLHQITVAVSAPKFCPGSSAGPGVEVGQSCLLKVRVCNDTHYGSSFYWLAADQPGAN